MNSAVLTTIAVTGFSVAFFHAAIPTHWLPFVLVSRARAWSRGKTLAVAAFAGLGHVLVTSALGFVIAWFGFELDARAGRWFPRAAGGILVAIGLFYFWRQGRGGVLHHHAPGGHHLPSEECGHEHVHSHWDDELQDSTLGSAKAGDWATISGLFLMLTLSPCEGFLPVYLSGVQFGWRGFAILSAILAVGALAGMLVFTWLTLVGMERLPLQKFERYEAALLGTIFCLLGILLIVLEGGG
jgi:ABC-type nickel/cobalt efflux system permease component RcnA